MSRILALTVALILLALPISATPPEPIQSLDSFFSNLMQHVSEVVEAVVDLIDGNTEDNEPIQTFGDDDDCTGPDCVAQELPPWADPYG